MVSAPAEIALPMREKLHPVRDWLASHGKPRPDGLPNLLVLLWFPVAVLSVLGTLVTLSISGSSTGQWWIGLGMADDPDLLAGTPRPIRSDEWLAQSSWVVSQVAQGLPARNHVFPGGMDATVFNDLPSRDWSTAFRPQLWGFFASLDQGMALRWWLPAALVLIAVYCFVVSLLPRQAGLAAVLALVAFWQPTLQWWFMPVTLLPIAFAFAAMTAVIWCVRCDSRRGRILASAIAGYLAVTMGMGIYAPFMISAVLAAVAFAVGYVVHAWRTEKIALGSLARRLVPLIVAGAGAGCVMGAWIQTRRDTVEAVLNTVYPGQRLTETGTAGKPQLVELLSGPFQRSLQVDVFDGFAGGNQSEAATPLLISLFLIVPMLWLLYYQRRRQLGTDWLIVIILLAQLLILAFAFLPGWDWLARFTLLDRTTPQRLRPAWLILAVVAVAVTALRLQKLGQRVPWLFSMSAGLLAVASSAFVWRELRSVGSQVVPSAYALVITLALALGVILVARRHLLQGAALFLICAAVTGAGVNPLYRGVVDLGQDTEAGREVTRLMAADPTAHWVGVGSALSMATVVETGAPGYSGVQTYPSATMWEQIDPQHAYEDIWNRLAHIYWVPGSGEPSPRTTTPDQIHLTFDSCANFAQEHVTYVLVDSTPLDQPCARQLGTFGQGSVQQWIYEVVPVQTQ